MLKNCFWFVTFFCLVGVDPTLSVSEDDYTTDPIDDYTAESHTPRKRVEKIPPVDDSKLPKLKKSKKRRRGCFLFGCKKDYKN